MRTRLAVLPAVLLVVGLLAACGSDSTDTTATTATTEADAPTTTAAAATPVALVARDFAFDVPAQITGGTVSFTYENKGAEPHFAAFAKIAAGKTLDDLKAALLTPPGSAAPSDPPPFTDLAGFPTANPGVKGAGTFNLPAGSYAFYCMIPSPDGVPHGAKGMIQPVTVTGGATNELPASVGKVKTVDFGFDAVPPLEPGTNVVQLDNAGKQLHEINLIEVPAGKKIEDVVAWFRTETGPPPFSFLTGVAVSAGTSGTGELVLDAGKTYAFICAVPDFLGDMKPHVTKGMRTATFTVS